MFMPMVQIGPMFMPMLCAVVLMPVGVSLLQRNAIMLVVVMNVCVQMAMYVIYGVVTVEV